MRTIVIRAACLVAAVAAASGTQVFVSAQVLFPAGGGIQQQAARSPQAAAAQQPATAAPQVRRLTADDAVKLAVENNLGIQISRFDPRIQDLNVLGARGLWSPSFTSTLQTNSIQRPSANIFTGSQETNFKQESVTSNFGLQQTLPWGGVYDLGWDSSRTDSNQGGNTFRPQLNSSLSLNYQQPLLRGWSIDNIRQQLQVSLKNREIADVGLRQTLASTTRTVRNSYWNLAYAVASLAVQQQSLDLAQESLRNTRARVEIGTTPPIDIVEAESEVAAREEAVIVAQASIATAEDTLRALVFDPAMPDFWTIRIEPTELPPFQPTIVDVDGAVRNALERRTDLQQTVKSMEATDVNIRFFRNQTLPDVTANLNYGLAALGGTRLPSSGGFPGLPVDPTLPTGPLEKGYPSVLRDLLGLNSPSWTASLNITYPIGASQADANLARARLQHSQAQTQLKNQQMQVGTQVRLQARNVTTNQQRVQSTRASRGLAERRLDAEQRKFQAGTSTSFLVFQAQRDLSQARNNELRAILDYNQSVVDFETVQEIPLGGGGVATVPTQ
ncbi:MAG TPA: TolC family protein [Vicinamibacterales bacterium]|nr:TolC family protein [Vicinamibacterales bacterium]